MINKLLCTFVAVVLAGSLAACEQLSKQNPIATKSSPESAETESKTTTEAHTKNEPHWNYEEDGPAEWSKHWTVCGEGKAQSPIDIKNASTSELPEIKLNFPTAELKIIHHKHIADMENSGHTIQADYSEDSEGGDTLKIGNVNYDLRQFHFHAPSEHTIDGKQMAMEMHLVHKTPDGKNIAVIGILIEQGTQTNDAFEPIWANLPKKQGEKILLENVEVDVDRFLPKSRTTYRYDGSFTTPPCSENVKWVVFSEPIQMSAEQIEKFTQLIKGNNRPTQPLNGRTVQTDRIEESDAD